jgi:hypothetical protein
MGSNSDSYSTNLRRNDLLYYHWQASHTLKETSDLTGIPQSTVWYYFNKFEKYVRKERPIPFLEHGRISTEFFDEEAQSILSREKLRKTVDDLLKDGKYREALELLTVSEKRRQLRIEPYQLSHDIQSWKKLLLEEDEEDKRKKEENTSSFPEDSHKIVRSAKDKGDSHVVRIKARDIFSKY